MHATVTDADLLSRLRSLNADYARRIDRGEYEHWPNFFTEPCLYKVTNSYNHERGYEAGAIYADSSGMLEDRISSLRQANIYEPQRYRHIIGEPVIDRVQSCTDGGAAIEAETPFVVYRIMESGRTDLFATGYYLDRILDQDGSLRFSERVVVCDSVVIDTLLVIPL